MTGRADRWIRRTTIGCVALLAIIAGTASYLHMHALVALHGQPGVGRCADAIVGRRDDRGSFDDAAVGFAVGSQGRHSSVGASVCGQCGEPGG